MDEHALNLRNFLSHQAVTAPSGQPASSTVSTLKPRAVVKIVLPTHCTPWHCATVIANTSHYQLLWPQTVYYQGHPIGTKMCDQRRNERKHFPNRVCRSCTQGLHVGRQWGLRHRHCVRIRAWFTAGSSGSGTSWPSCLSPTFFCNLQKENNSDIEYVGHTRRCLQCFEERDKYVWGAVSCSPWPLIPFVDGCPRLFFVGTLSCLIVCSPFFPCMCGHVFL